MGEQREKQNARFPVCVPEPSYKDDRKGDACNGRRYRGGHSRTEAYKRLNIVQILAGGG
jgi:hypothetical protein